MSDYGYMVERLKAEQRRAAIQRLRIIEAELREEIRDASLDTQREVSDLFASLRARLTGEEKPHVAAVGKRGPWPRVVPSPPEDLNELRNDLTQPPGVDDPYGVA